MAEKKTELPSERSLASKVMSVLGRVFVFGLYGLIPILVLFAIWAGFNIRSPASANEPLVTPALETTFYTEPLDENGDVDYVAAINQQYSQGVTSENNALLEFLKVLVPENDSTDFHRLVGFDQELDDAPFIGFESWYAKVENESERRNPNAMIEFKFAKQSPWKGDQFPQLEAWLTAGEGPVKTFTKGLAREKYFHPLCSPTSKPAGPAVLSASLQLVTEIMKVGDYFQVRSMHHLGNEDPQQAFDDVNHLFLLANLLSQGSTLVEHQFSAELVEAGCNCAFAICRHESTSAEHLKAFFENAAQPDTTNRLDTCLNHVSRAMLLEALIHSLRSENELPIFLRATADRAAGLEFINEWFDRLVVSASVENDAERLAQFDELIEELEALASKIDDMQSFSRNVLMGRRETGAAIGKIMLAHMAPDFRGVAGLEISKKASFRMLQLYTAAEIHRRANGSYPQSPMDIKEFFGNEIPKEPITGKEFIFDVYEGELTVDCSSFQSLPVPSLSWDEFCERHAEPTMNSDDALEMLRELIEEQKSAEQ